MRVGVHNLLAMREDILVMCTHLAAQSVMAVTIARAFFEGEGVNFALGKIYAAARSSK
jgi:hypothetical protein